MGPDCLTEERLDQLASGKRPKPPERDHLRQCTRCRTLLENLRRTHNFVKTVVRPAIKARREVEAEALSFGPYTNCRLIGRGGMASVYAGQAPGGETVAIKVCRRQDALPWFRREVESMRMAAIDGIPPLVATDLAHLPAYFVTRYYPGGNLEERLKKGALAPRELLVLWSRLAGILAGLETRGLVHRDLKPSNILFDERGEAWLADLGLARQYQTRDDASADVRLETLCATMTRPESPPVTVSYMSPEQASNESLTGASDVFSLGVTMYEALTRHNPFEGKTIHIIASKVLGEKPPPPPSALTAGVPTCINTLILASLEKNPARRPTAKKVHDECKKMLREDNLPIEGIPNPKENNVNAEVKKTLVEAIRMLETNKLPVSPLTKVSIRALESPVYRIGFLGQYQVGKSTLINRVFLRDEVLLKEGVGLCTTAVATEIAYGPAKQMEIVPWATSRESVSVSVSGETHSGDVDVITGPGTPKIIANPTPADIAKATTASNPSARTELARTTAAVRLAWPRECLRRYTLLDTPGINDPNTLLLDNTTYRLLPELDVAILVVEPRDLGEIELQFLRGRVLDQGLSRVMILVSHKADRRDLPQESREEILGAIRGQLASIGRAYIPVQMYCFDQTVTGNILNTSDALEQAILAFLADNVEPGRIEKALFAVKRDLHTALLEVATRQIFAGKASADKEALLAKIRETEADLRDTYQRCKEGIETELRNLKKRLVHQAGGRISTIGEHYLAGFDLQKGLSHIHDRLAQAEPLMKQEIEQVVFDLLDTARKEAEAILRGQEAKIRLANEPWRKMLEVNLKIEGGLLANVPPPLVFIGDLLLSIMLPGGPLFNLLERWIATKIPLLKEIVPTRLVAHFLMESIKTSVRTEMGKVAGELEKHLADAITQFTEATGKELDGSFDREVAAIRKTAEASMRETIKQEELEALARTKKALEGVIASL